MRVPVGLPAGWLGSDRAGWWCKVVEAAAGCLNHVYAPGIGGRGCSPPDRACLRRPGPDHPANLDAAAGGWMGGWEGVSGWRKLTRRGCSQGGSGPEGIRAVDAGLLEQQAGSTAGRRQYPGMVLAPLRARTFVGPLELLACAGHRVSVAGGLHVAAAARICRQAEYGWKAAGWPLGRRVKHGQRRRQRRY